MNIFASFKPADFVKYTSALQRLLSVPKIADSMCQYGAIEYKTEVMQAIATGNYTTRLPRLSKKYLEWKVSHGFPRDIGRLKGDLLGAIGVFPIMGGWFGGVDPYKFDSGDKNWSLRGPSKQIAKYGMWLEEGNRVGRSDWQRPRRIFVPIAKRYEKTGYPKLIDKTIRRVEQLWH